jgi:SfnB family sulfur acquisition oxidoreductase
MNIVAKPRPAETVHRIGNDAEALEIATRLAADFRTEAATRDAERRLPYAEIERFSQSGLWGISVPKPHGGAGVSATTVAEVIAIISAADGSLGQIPQNHYYMVEALQLDGSEAQKQFFFERVLAGERIANALAEASGKFATDHATTILPTQDGYVVNGRKFYCTGSLFGHWIAAVGNSADGKRTIALVPRDTKGLSVIDDWSGFGQRTTGSGSVVFDNVPVGALGVVDHYRAFERPTAMGAFAQILHAAVDLGIARGAFAATLDFIRNHARPWIDSGKDKASEDPYTISAIGDLSTRLTAAEALVRRAGRYVEIARENPLEGNVAEASIAVAEARVATTDVSLQISNALFELGGTRSTLEALNLNVYWRNARTHTLHDPVRWKYFSIGNYWLNGTPPPRRGSL